MCYTRAEVYLVQASGGAEGRKLKDPRPSAHVRGIVIGSVSRESIRSNIYLASVVTPSSFPLTDCLISSSFLNAPKCINGTVTSSNDPHHVKL